MPDNPVPMVSVLVVLAVTVVDPPRLTAFPLIVIELLVSALLGMFVSVLVEPLIDVPANVVNVLPNDKFVEPMVTELLVNELLPIFDNVLLVPLIVLLVSVWIPVSVATVLSIAIVTGVDPLKLVPDNPVPIVNELVVLAVTVVDPPNDTELPLIVIALLAN